MMRRLTMAAIVLIAAGMSAMQAQTGYGITNGFPYPVNPFDTITSPFLPQAPAEIAGSHGFLKVGSDGGFVFQDETPARFFATSLEWFGNLPDSVQAILMAARMHKLGINLVRFDYLDINYVGYQPQSIMNVYDGGRTLSDSMMRRFDWLVYQLKKNGVYCYLPLQSVRTPLRTDGLPPEIADSVMFRGRAGLHYLYPQAGAAHRLAARLIMEHVNPFTGTAYKAEPAIAMLDMFQEGSMLSYYRYNYLINNNTGQYGPSWHISRRIDTLYNQYLANKYGTNFGLDVAWKTTPPNGGFPNLVNEGSFEGNYDQYWLASAGNGVTAQPILRSGDSTPDGQVSMTIRVRNGRGNVGDAYMYTPVRMKYNKVYKISFSAKCNNADGRQIYLYSYQSIAPYLYGGLSKYVPLTPYWKKQEVTFYCGVDSPSDFYMFLMYGDKDGEVSIDDIQLREIQPVGLAAGESIDNISVNRIPYGGDIAYTVCSQRVEDQTDFYMKLEGDYLNGMYRYLHDTLKVGQPVTGCTQYYASNLMEAAVERTMDFAATTQGWDYTYNDAQRLRIAANTSPLRATYTGALYNMAVAANEHQPLMTFFIQPYVNRYQAESMLLLPSYASLQGWSSISWNTFADAPLTDNRLVDSINFYVSYKNPVVAALMPVASQIFRAGYVAKALNTLRLQRTRRQIRQMSRLEGSTGSYGVPGYINSFAQAISRVANDSLDAAYMTQAGDYSFGDLTPGEIRSDTRELFWEYNRGSLSVDAANVQGVSGYLTRSEGFNLSKLKAELLSDNETVTAVWTPIGSTVLGDTGRSFLVIATRTEPTGFIWNADSTKVDAWGTAPMLMEPARMRFTFKALPGVLGVRIAPLDSTGMPMKRDPIFATKTADGFTAVIDQRATHAVWYSVQMLNSAAGVQATTTGILRGAALTACPNLIGSGTDNAELRISLPVNYRAITVTLYDALGRRVRELYAGPATAGLKAVGLDAGTLPTGAYTVRLVGDRGEYISTEVRVVR